MKKANKGFTLIELLVVIAIISILSTLAVVSLGSARIKSRDAKRVSDVRQMSTALELYYNDLGSYPVAITSGNSISTVSATYMAFIPTNPSPQNDGLCPLGNNYDYQSIGNPPTAYTITYCLGGQTGDLAAGTHTANQNGIR